MGMISIARIIMIFGFIVFFVTLFYSQTNTAGGPPALPIPVFPVFENPFTNTITTISLIPDVPWNYSSTIPQSVTGTAHGCSLYQAYNCVRDPDGPDGNITYVTIQRPTFFNFEVNLTSLRVTAGTVVYGSAFVWCRAHGNDTQIDADVTTAPSIAVHEEILTSIGNGYLCPTSDFKMLSIPMQTAISQPYDLSGVATVAFSVSVHWDGVHTQPLDQVDFSTFRVSISVSGAVASCGGGAFFSNIGCQISNLWQNIVNYIIFGFNVVIFIFQWGLVIVSLVAGIFGVIVWMFAIPGMPTVVQGFIDVFLLGAMGALLLEVAGVIRGSGSAE